MVIFRVGALGMPLVAIRMRPMGGNTMLGAYFMLDEGEVRQHRGLTAREYSQLKDACCFSQW
jgi:hypothetical protein